MLLLSSRSSFSLYLDDHLKLCDMWHKSIDEDILLVRMMILGSPLELCYRDYLES